jgi:methionyl-tRNA synthetase
MLGKRVRFITGTDEHGEKIALAAAGRGMSPKEHCDSIVDEYKALWAKVCVVPGAICSGLGFRV